MHRLAAVCLLLAATAARADDPRVELPDLVGKAKEHAGKTVRIPGALDAKTSTVYGCGFSKAKFDAIEITDRGKHMVVYCAKSHPTLACASTFKTPTKIQYALVRVAATCKDTRGELLDY